MAVIQHRMLFGGASTLVHDNGTILRINGTIRTEGQQSAILSYMDKFSADPEDPRSSVGCRNSATPSPTSPAHTSAGQGGRKPRRQVEPRPTPAWRAGTGAACSPHVLTQAVWGPGRDS